MVHPVDPIGSWLLYFDKSAEYFLRFPCGFLHYTCSMAQKSAVCSSYKLRPHMTYPNHTIIFQQARKSVLHEVICIPPHPLLFFHFYTHTHIQYLGKATGGTSDEDDVFD